MSRFRDPEEKAAQQVNDMRLRRQLQRERGFGFDARRHLRTITANGDAQVLQDLYAIERGLFRDHGCSRGPSSMLATYGILELRSALEGRPDQRWV